MGGGILRKRFFIGYLGISLLLAVVVIMNFLLGGGYTNYIHGKITNYNNPLLILSSVCLFMTFEQLTIKNNKVVNWFAASAISVLLIHTSPVIFKYYSEWFNFIFTHTTGDVTIFFWSCSIFLIYGVCTLIDQFRIVIQKKLVDKYIY